MDKIDNMNKYILDQVKDGNIKKEVAMSILKESFKGNKNKCNDVAIIGVACRFSDAENKEEYWEDLTQGLCTIRKFPKERRNDIEPFVSIYDDLGDDPYCKVGFLEEINKFDSSFFRISPREADLMDPKQRLFLEVLYEAVEDAGYGGEKIYGTETGIFVGNDHSSDGKLSYSSIIRDSDMLSMTGCSSGILASRASYIFDLKGPSAVIDTACSSGLVSVHMACEAIKNEECKMAIAGGINILLYPRKIGMMSEIESDGSMVKTFDKNAMGTSWGEGVSALLLKPLNKAIEDKDNIYAVIKGTAINNDGASNGITAPSAEAQEKLIIKAWERAGIKPETISYIETHGTGTILGDPIEIKGITRAFKKYTNKKQFCGIGSVKPNIGHTVAAAGLASIVKVVLSMKHGVIPPSLNFEEPNPFINFCNSPVFVNDKLMKWEKGNTPRRAGISSFGFSGTNSHIVLEEAPKIIEYENKEETMEILTLSAKDNKSLKSLVKRYYNFLHSENDYSLQDICYTANTGRKHLENRLSIVVKDKDDLKKKIKQLNDIQLDLREAIKFSDEEQRKYKGLAAEKIETFVNDGRTDISIANELCEYYEKGVDIDWSKLYKGVSRRRVSIPTYPYKKERHWVKVPKIKREAKKSENEVNEKFIKVELMGRSNNTYSEVENTIAQIWGNVLGFDKLTIYSDFYGIGGDSITAIKIIHTVNKQLGIKAEATALFKASTIERFSEYIENILLNKDNKAAKSEEIVKVKEAEYYEVSSSQKRVYILNQLNPSDTTYNIPLFLTVEGRLNEEKLENAFNKLVERHETLRTTFKLIDNKVMQKIEDNVEIKIEKFIGKDNELNEIINKFVRTFNLSKGPLIRIGLVKINDEKHLLMIDVHHIAADGYSIPILEKEFMDFYGDETKTPLKIQFKDFAAWQNKLLKTKPMENQEKYWMEKLKGKLPILNLPYDFSKTPVQSYEGERISFNAGKDLTNKLNKASAETRSTLFMFLMAAFNVLLYKCTGQRDIMIGSPIAGRTHEDLHELIGMFVNTIALRNDVNPKKSFKNFLLEVREGALDAYQNQDYPFDELIEKLKLDRNLDSNALFNVMFACQVMDNPIIETNNLRYVPYNYENKTSKFDIVLDAFPSNEDIRFELAYCSKLFKKSTIESFANHYLNILERAVSNMDMSIKDIDVMRPEEKEEIIKFNKKPSVINVNGKNICEAFERAVITNENNIAVEGSDGKLTYKELNNKANKLARTLLLKGANKDNIIGIMADRTTNFVVSIMAILKAGAAYLPIDINYPDKRINYMLENSKASMLLADNESINRVQGNVEIINIDDERSYAEDSSNLNLEISEDNLAYVIYTSGSTGKPKGVMIEHKNVINLVHALNEEIYRMYKDKLNVALLAPFVFDASVKQIFPTLLLGNKLSIIPGDTRIDGIKLVKYYKEHLIHVSDGTPAYISIMSDIESSGQLPVKHFVIGGEALKIKEVKRFYKNFNSNKPLITNVYGPTECCVDTTAYTIKPENIESIDKITIGKPIENCRVYILDQDKNILPKGITGELYIGGKGVGRGYINNSELTNEKFVKDITESKERMYKTGDLGKWDENGNIQFVGREDHQVKIRGFRIELDEIRNELLTYKYINDAVVVLKNNTIRGNYICAYVVSDDDNIGPKLKEYLANYLPDYMIPSNIVVIKEIPLTNNGKVDTKLLKDPVETLEAEIKYVAPRNYVEEILCKIWGEVLGSDNIGIKNNFFVSGGDSIKAIQAAARMEKYNFSLEVKDIFQYQTIEDVGVRVKPLNKTADNSIVEGEGVLAPMQYWLLDHCSHTINHRNLSFILYRKEGFGEENVKIVFEKLVIHHDALRMTFKEEEGVIKTQYNNRGDGKLFDLKVIDLRNSQNFKEDAYESINKIQESFDLINGPVIKLGLIKAKEGEHLLITVHQMVIDHISWRIIFEDFINGYMQLINDKEIEFQNKTDSFIKWSQYINKYSNSNELLAEKKYWKEVESIKVEPIPTDFVSESTKIKDNKSIFKNLETEETKTVMSKIKGNKKYKIDSVFLTALNLTINQYCNNNKVAVNLGNHGRDLDTKDINISRTVGRFSAIYPVILEMNKTLNSIENLEYVNSYLNNIPSNGAGYGILKYVTSKENKLDIDFKLKPEISFNYMGEFDNDLNTNIFEMSPISTGKNISDNENCTYKLKFICLVKMGKLNIGIEYNKKLFKEDTIDNMLNSYIQHLRNTIKYII